MFSIDTPAPVLSWGIVFKGGFHAEDKGPYSENLVFIGSEKDDKLKIAQKKQVLFVRV